MTESVKDEITVRIVYEGRAAKVALKNGELEKIEKYYNSAAEAGANEYQIEKSKQETANMYSILGDPQRLETIAQDFIHHYENRLNEGSTVKGKAMIVCSSREIAYDLYKNIVGFLARRSLGEWSSRSIESTNFSAHFTKSFGYPEEWHRGRVPHRNKEGLIQFITFRLADSLPQDILQEIERELAHLSGEDKVVEKRKKYEYWLDQGIGKLCAIKKRNGGDNARSSIASRW